MRASGGARVSALSVIVGLRLIAVGLWRARYNRNLSSGSGSLYETRVPVPWQSWTGVPLVTSDRTQPKAASSTGARGLHARRNRDRVLEAARRMLRGARRPRPRWTRSRAARAWASGTVSRHVPDGAGASRGSPRPAIGFLRPGVSHRPGSRWRCVGFPEVRGVWWEVLDRQPPGHARLEVVAARTPRRSRVSLHRGREPPRSPLDRARARVAPAPGWSRRDGVRCRRAERMSSLGRRRDRAARARRERASAISRSRSRRRVVRGGHGSAVACARSSQRGVRCIRWFARRAGRRRVATHRVLRS